MNNNWLKFLVAIAAIMIAGSAAYFSVTGLGVLFSGAAIAVMVMASSLEFAKLVTATYLKQEWDNIKGLNKWYLTSAVVILMAITSAGIFGYLSNAFQQQNLKLEQVQREIDVWNNKITTDTSQISLYTNQLNQLQSNNNTVLGNSTNRSSLRFATSTSKEQSKIRNKISALNDSVVVYNSKINDIKNANISIEKEVGGFRFVAEAFNVELNSVVKFFIILIVVVFDPLAVALIISFNQLVMVGKRKDEDDIKPINEPSTNPEDLKHFADEAARLHLSEEDLKKLEEVLLKPQLPNDKLKEAAQRYSDEVREKHTHIDDFNVDKKWNGVSQEVWDRMKEIQKYNESIHGPILPEDEPVGALANSEYRERGEILAEMMKNDQELGLYDEPFNNPMIKEVEERDEEPYAGPILSSEVVEELQNPIFQNDNLPAYDVKNSDEEINDWDITLMDGLEDEENNFHEEPTIEEEEQNFSTIEPENENIFQEEEQFNIPVDEAVDNEPELIFSDEFITQAIQEFNQESIEDEDEPIYQSETKEIDQMLDIVNNVIDEEVNESETSPEKDDEKKN
jgi:hypothetical protein